MPALTVLRKIANNLELVKGAPRQKLSCCSSLLAKFLHCRVFLGGGPAGAAAIRLCRGEMLARIPGLVIPSKADHCKYQRQSDSSHFPCSMALPVVLRVLCCRRAADPAMEMPNMRKHQRPCSLVHSIPFFGPSYKSSPF